MRQFMKPYYTIALLIVLISGSAIFSRYFLESSLGEMSSVLNSASVGSLTFSEMFGTGAVRSSDALNAWEKNNIAETKSVRVNAVGLERINAYRINHGKKAVSSEDAGVVPVGQEVVITEKKNAKDKSIIDIVKDLPVSVDNSLLQYFPPIRSQGVLNSSAQFSPIYYTLTYMNAFAHDLDAKNGGDDLRFSPKWTYTMVNEGYNINTSYLDAFAIAKTHGLATWKEFPYDRYYREWNVNPDVWKQALSRKVDVIGAVRNLHTDFGLSNLKQLLNSGYILNINTYINSWVWNTIQNDLSVNDDDMLAGKRIVTSVNGVSGGHTMVVVGYNDAVWVDLNRDGIVQANEKGALRVANSWGTEWEENGFSWIAYGALRTRNSSQINEGILWNDSAVWATMRYDYTPKLVGRFSLTLPKRDQIFLRFGIGSTTVKDFDRSLDTFKALTYSGGSFAFDGGTIARTGVFYADFTDSIPVHAGMDSYVISILNSNMFPADKKILESFTLIDTEKNKSFSFPDAPEPVNGPKGEYRIDYDFKKGEFAPIISTSIEPKSGDIPLVVSFDASRSTSTEGAIRGYKWKFGDGGESDKATTTHVFVKAGEFKVVSSVTDSNGNVIETESVITAIDPDIIQTPALGVSILLRTLTLGWSVEKSRVSSYMVERAPQGNRGPGRFVRLTTVGPSQTSFTDTLKYDGTYYYRVKAFNAKTGRESEYSNVVPVVVQ
jgi:PKD repeat protein